MSNSEDYHGGVAVDHGRQIPRLHRIEGQIRGLQQMIENGRYCGDVVNQIDAAIAALRRVQIDMLRDHILACVEASISGNLSDAERQHLTDEIGRLMTNLGRTS